MRTLIFFFAFFSSASAAKTPLDFTVELRNSGEHGEAERLVFKTNFAKKKFIAKSSRYSAHERFELGVETAAFLEQELFVREKIFEKWKLPPTAGCRSGRLEMSVTRGSQNQTWKLCHDDQQHREAGLARGWFLFLRKSLAQVVDR